MNKIYVKLIAIILTLALSVTVVVMSSYAWFVLSGNPVATGIQVAVSGGNTILIASDITEEVDGVIYHYPGGFSDKLQINRSESYSYLQTVGGLAPVSTADGINWFLPTYYDFSDREVREGKVLSGELKDISEFKLDDTLAHANLSSDQTRKIEEGNYLYLDFWVVAPGADYTLRLSSGDENGGSFLVDLMQPATTEDAIGYTMEDPKVWGSTAVRVGFLTNEAGLTDDTMLHYQNSPYFNERFTKLRGLYQDPNSGNANLGINRFTIYEPNCDMNYQGNPTGYSVTNPVGWNGTVAEAISVNGQVSAQKTSTWLGAQSGSGNTIVQHFKTAVMDMDTEQMNLEQINQTFYSDYLQYQVAPYVNKGSFIKNSADLYKFGEKISFDQMSQLDTQGATEDVSIIRLERNTPQRIRMFIWLEGQDKDCVNAVNVSDFILSIELAGATE